MIEARKAQFNEASFVAVKHVSKSVDESELVRYDTVGTNSTGSSDVIFYRHKSRPPGSLHLENRTGTAIHHNKASCRTDDE